MFLEISQNSQENTYARVSFLIKGVFQWVLRNFQEHLLYRIPLEDCFSKKKKNSAICVKSLLGHLVCSEETQKKMLESDIFRIPESKGVTEIGSLNKVSPSKFVLFFGSKTVKEKLKGT